MKTKTQRQRKRKGSKGVCVGGLGSFFMKDAQKGWVKERGVNEKLNE